MASKHPLTELLHTTGGVRISQGLNPRRNLLPKVAQKRGESWFARAFEREYFRLYLDMIGIARREFDFAGYGIADLVWVSWPSREMASEGSAVGIERQLRRLRVTAFEMKLRDWRKALTQAFRYSYFADTSVVVVPPAVADIARQAIDEFRRLKVGLWSFEPETTVIKRHYTPPKGTKAKNLLAREKAIASLLALAKLRQSSK